MHRDTIEVILIIIIVAVIGLAGYITISGIQSKPTYNEYKNSESYKNHVRNINEHNNW